MYHQPGTIRCPGGNRNVLRSFGPCAQAAPSAHPSSLGCSAAQVQSPSLSYRHLLMHNHRQMDFPVDEAVLKAVHDCPLGKQRCPALADMLEDCLFSEKVQIRILLACKGGRR